MSVSKPLSGLFLACMLTGAEGFAVAQEYPSQVLRIIVPFPAGGSTDTYARIVANELRAVFGKSTIVENRAGATRAVGTQAVRQSAPDGYEAVGDPPQHFKDSIEAEVTAVSRLIREIGIKAK